MTVFLRRMRLPILAAMGLVVLGATWIASAEREADAAANHGALVPEAPRTGLPQVADGKVFAHARVGDRIFVGGDFDDVELQDGQIISQPYIFAYHVDTGEFDHTFRPVVNKLIRALEPAPDGSGVYVGGLFTSWDGAFPLRMAKLDNQGNLITSFDADASARVMSISARSDTVFIGGDFTSVNGATRKGLAAVDASTGAVDSGFVMDLENSVTGSRLARTIELTSDGNHLFALHYGSTIDGQVREAIAKIDVSGPTASLSGWNVPWIAQTNDWHCWGNLRDMAISPDDSFVVVGGQGADNPTNCDSVLKYSTAGSSTVTFDWSARMYSSVFSLGVSDVAIYVGGHFCAAPKNPIPPGGVSSTWPGTANKCDVNDPFDPLNPSELDPANAVFRKQFTALDPITGQGLVWDGESNNFVAVYDITVIDRGVLAGHDRDRFKDTRVGRSGFFDFGAPSDTTPPTVHVTDPAPGEVITAPVQIAGTAADNIDPVSVSLTLQETTSGQWLQGDGTMGATQTWLAATLVDTGLGTVAWSRPVSGLGEGSYQVSAIATDGAGNTSTTDVSGFSIPGATQCTVTLDAENHPVLSWAGFDDGVETTVFLRRDGTWMANGSAPSGTYADDTAQPGDHSYLVRWRPSGVVTDVPCTPDPINVPEPAGPTCTVALNPSGHVDVAWNEIVGVSTYQVRDQATGWIATVDNAFVYTDTDPESGARTYVVRHRVGGQPIDTVCTPDPINI
ncbi:MAG: hypothetical protein ACR2P0_01875 [Acidimicrobiales bacterium]